MQRPMEKDQIDKQGTFEEAVEGLLIMTDMYTNKHTTRRKKRTGEVFA